MNVLRTLVVAVLAAFLSVASAQTEPKNADTKKAEAKKAEPKKAEPKKAEPKKAAPKKSAPAKAPAKKPPQQVAPGVTRYSDPKDVPVMRDAQGNVIPSSPDAYDVSSATGKKKK